jgi:hypothetical protein
MKVSLHHPLRTPAEKRRALADIRRAHPGNHTKIQCSRILAAMAKLGCVNTFEITRFLGVYDATARISQMRDSGISIDRHWQYALTEDNSRHRIGLYVLGAA